MVLGSFHHDGYSYEIPVRVVCTCITIFSFQTSSVSQTQVLVALFLSFIGSSDGWQMDRGKIVPSVDGMFGCAVACWIFSAIVLDGVDTIVMCYAIDKDNGLAASDFQKKAPAVATRNLVQIDMFAKRERGCGEK